jgi:hypothetical protein
MKLLPALLSLALSASSLEAGLLAYYPFDGDFNDASGNANHLSITEGLPTITTTAGNFIAGGGALDTASTISDRAFLALTNPITFADTDAWSIAFWARRRAGSDIRQGMVIGDTENNIDFIWLSDNPTQVQGVRFRSTDNNNFNFDVGADDGEWHHWALVADGTGNLTAYRDNIALGTSTSSTPFSVRNVAHGYNTDIHSMNGQIDELHIYDEALDATAVEALFLGSGLPDFTITSIRYAADSNQITLTWDSQPGESYVVRFSRDLIDWGGDLNDGVDATADSDQTTMNFDLEDANLTGVEEIFFRVEKR